jgi:hypothetical protein
MGIREILDWTVPANSYQYFFTYTLLLHVYVCVCVCLCMFTNMTEEALMGLWKEKCLVLLSSINDSFFRPLTPNDL